MTKKDLIAAYQINAAELFSTLQYWVKTLTKTEVLFQDEISNRTLKSYQQLAADSYKRARQLAEIE